MRMRVWFWLRTNTFGAFQTLQIKRLEREDLGVRE